MVGTIVSIGYGEISNKAAGAIAWHLVGLLLGGATLGLLVAALGHLIGFLVDIDTRKPAFAAAGLVSLVYATRELGFTSVPYPQLRRQVPRWWSLVFKPGAYSFLYGVLLGLGFVTHVWVASLFPVVTFAALDASAAAATVLGVVFGVARGLPLVALHVTRRRWSGVIDVLDYVHARREAVHQFNGVALAFAGVLMLLSSIAWDL
jgi:hypothetical protein